MVERAQRRLTTILAANVAGLSRLTGADEERRRPGGTRDPFRQQTHLGIDPGFRRGDERDGKNAAPRLSIIVLPFANIGGDPEQEYFVDGVAESLTTASAPGTKPCSRHLSMLGARRAPAG